MKKNFLFKGVSLLGAVLLLITTLTPIQVVLADPTDSDTPATDSDTPATDSDTPATDSDTNSSGGGGGGGGGSSTTPIDSTTDTTSTADLTLDADGALPEEFSGDYTVDLNGYSLTLPNQTETYQDYLDSISETIDTWLIVDHRNFFNAASSELKDYYDNNPTEALQDGVKDLSGNWINHSANDWGKQNTTTGFTRSHTPCDVTQFPWFVVNYNFDGNTTIKVYYDESEVATWKPEAKTTQESGSEVDRTYSINNLTSFSGFAGYAETAGGTENLADSDKFKVKLFSGEITSEADRGVSNVTVKFENADENIPLTFVKGDDGKISIQEPTDTPSKEGSIFKGWTNNGEDYTFGEAIDGDVTLVAKWEEKKSSSSSNGSSGGGGGGSSKTSTTDDTKATTGDTAKVDENKVEDNTQTDGNGSDNNESTDSQKALDDGFTQEFHDAYDFAFKNGITTMPSIAEADMNGTLTRIAMAKMLSQYAINVLGKTPDTGKNISFPDVSPELDAQYNSGVTLAYQLGIMGINIDEFRPFDEVTRAEFVTALSRMLFGLSDGENLYYETHMQKLLEEKIITVADPDMKELRGYVMIMLMRSADK